MWKWWQFYCVLLHLWARSSCQKTALDSPFNLMVLRAFRNWSFDAFGRTGTEERYLQLARDAGKVQEVIPDHVPFPCNVTVKRSAEIPNSVHKLRPGDIDVIATMGDSLTAGAGIFANNIFQEFNPNLIGYALGDALASHEASQLNVAESGAFSEDMPYMAEVLVKRIKSDPRIDLQKHWKFVSIMIGDNDFCTNMCWVSSPWSILEKHKEHMLQVLRTLRDNLPRTFVALIPPPHLKALVETRIGRPSFKCFVTTDIECSCMFGSVFQKSKSTYYEIMRRWQEMDLEIAASPEFQRNDFAVVAQPLMMDASIPLASDGYSDITYLSSDCFHISQKANAWFANSLWNNLLAPVGTKETKLHGLFERFHCPTPERPYLATMLNSRKQSF
ncbi:Phospholipase B1, membrane-associated [Ooceraea biroi]|uniref:Phospholipase B1, membrane-associated n=1 Tax=Ooceraea biroi TaxID=2015173 RepID=A0A026X0A0_OOCBI|nr:Phospholipase B1, membrane-associated [Ooceraea biroi]